MSDFTSVVIIRKQQLKGKRGASANNFKKSDEASPFWMKFDTSVINYHRTPCSLQIWVKTAENVWNEYLCSCSAGSAAWQASWCCEVNCFECNLWKQHISLWLANLMLPVHSAVPYQWWIWWYIRLDWRSSILLTSCNFSHQSHLPVVRMLSSTCQYIKSILSIWLERIANINCCLTGASWQWIT